MEALLAKRNHASSSWPRATRYLLAAAFAGLGCGGGNDPGGPPSDVSQLFADSCAGTGCHVDYGAQPGGELDLSTGQACASLVGVPAVEVPTIHRVVPGDSQGSYLMCKLVADCPDRPVGATRMPVGAPDGLPADQLDLVARWIDDGAPGCDGLDEEAPSFAGAGSATALPSAIRIDWEAASDNRSPPGEIVYLVYEAQTSGGQDLAQPSYTTAPGATSWTAGGLPLSTTFYYVVRARDALGNTDDNTVEVSATTPATGDETAPTFAGLESATASGSSSALLSWQPATDDVTPADDIVYHVYAAEAAGAQDFGQPVSTTPPGAVEAFVTGLSPATEYYFVVRAEDGAGNEEQNTVEVAVTTGDATSFSGRIEPLLDATCGSFQCHGGPMPAQDLDLRAGNAYGALVGVESTQCAGRLRVSPGQPEASYLINKLTGVDMCFGTKMPKVGSLSQPDLQSIIDWIAEGAADN